MIFEVPGSLFWAKMGPTLDPNRIFDAEAFRKPLGGLLERSWRLLEPKKQSWNRSWSALGGLLNHIANLRILGIRPGVVIRRVLGGGGEEPGGGEQASRPGSQSSRTVKQKSQCSRTVEKRKSLRLAAGCPWQAGAGG